MASCTALLVTFLDLCCCWVRAIASRRARPWQVSQPQRVLAFAPFLIHGFGGVPGTGREVLVGGFRQLLLDVPDS